MRTLLETKDVNWQSVLIAVVATVLLFVLVRMKLNFYFILPLSLGFFGIVLMIFSPVQLFKALLAISPLSLFEVSLLPEAKLSIPTDPLCILFLGIIIFHMIYSFKSWIPILKRPLSLLLLGSLVWIGFTTIFSQLPLVSLKYFLNRLWFIIPIYFLSAYLLKYGKMNTQSIMIYFGISFSLVALITTMKHLPSGFSEQASFTVMNPFYRDHTQYGAACAMMLLWPLAMKFGKNKLISVLMMALSVGLISLCLIHTYSRAALITVIMAMAIVPMMYWKWKFSKMITLVSILVAALIYIFPAFVMELEQNKTTSSETYSENLESVTNITTDESNIERLNRWSAAIDMFVEEPIVGFGPGTYMFLYAPYQRSKYLTTISTNFSTLGNAHSEYLGRLCEQGLIGMLLFVAVILWVLFLGFTNNRKLIGTDRKLNFILLFGFVTYLLHGFFNNYLESDKLAIPFFLTLALISNLYYGNDDVKS